MKELFPIGSVRTEPEMLPLMDDKIIVLKDEVQVRYCVPDMCPVVLN